MKNKWDDLKIFINYGMLTQEDFYEKLISSLCSRIQTTSITLSKNIRHLIKDNQTDKNGSLIYLYANNLDEQYTYIDAAKNKGYNVLLMDGQLDVPMINMLEQKFEKSHFTRVDSDIIDRLIVKEDQKGEELPHDPNGSARSLFNGQMPKVKKTEFHVETHAWAKTIRSIVITQAEYMRRMKDMASIQPGMSFYGEMPDMFNLVLEQRPPTD